MASLPNSSVDFPQNSLEAIGKDFIGRERSASPEPVDLGSPEGHDSNIDTIDFDPGSRGVGKSPGHSHTPLRGRNISRDAQSPVHDLGDSTSASHVARSDDTRPFVHFSPDSKVGSGDSYGFDRSLKRNSTNITNASASLEETRIWDQKAILSLGTLQISTVSCKLGKMDLTSFRWRWYTRLLRAFDNTRAYESYRKAGACS